MFMLLASVTPFIFVQMKKLSLAIAQTVLLVGMWLYYFAAVFQTAPAAFSITWTTFYLSLLLAEVAWVMFIIAAVKSSEAFQNMISE